MILQENWLPIGEKKVNMRLIDADKLNEQLLELQIPLYAVTTLTKCIIPSQKNVEAIPIEWIEKYIEQKEQIRDRYEYRSSAYEHFDDIVDLLEVMLEDWRSEND